MANDRVILKVTKEENVSGDRQAASQGFGRIDAGFAVHFEPEGQREAACDYFEKYGFVVLDDCLSTAEIGRWRIRPPALAGSYRMEPVSGTPRPASGA